MGETRKPQHLSVALEGLRSIDPERINKFFDVVREMPVEEAAMALARFNRRNPLAWQQIGTTLEAITAVIANRQGDGKQPPIFTSEEISAIAKLFLSFKPILPLIIEQGYPGEIISGLEDLLTNYPELSKIAAPLLGDLLCSFKKETDDILVSACLRIVGCTMSVQEASRVLTLFVKNSTSYLVGQKTEAVFNTMRAVLNRRRGGEGQPLILTPDEISAIKDFFASYGRRILLYEYKGCEDCMILELRSFLSSFPELVVMAAIPLERLLCSLTNKNESDKLSRALALVRDKMPVQIAANVLAGFNQSNKSSLGWQMTEEMFLTMSAVLNHRRGGEGQPLILTPDEISAMTNFFKSCQRRLSHIQLGYEASFMISGLHIFLTSNPELIEMAIPLMGDLLCRFNRLKDHLTLIKCLEIVRDTSSLKVAALVLTRFIRENPLITQTIINRPLTPLIIVTFNAMSEVINRRRQEKGQLIDLTQEEITAITDFFNILLEKLKNHNKNKDFIDITISKLYSFLCGNPELIEMATPLLIYLQNLEGCLTLTCNPYSQT